MSSSPKPDPAQPELFRSPLGDPNVDWLEHYLDERHGWVRAAKILQELGLDDDEWRKREIRKLASASPWIISGQLGYRHLRHSTADEVKHFCAGFLSQIRLMAKRFNRIRRNAHAIFG